ncbi:NADPH-dependent F420 reductase [Hoeflea poritis]|uniref:NAD(P)-binding domain-containing protein n=1 Tax=Hoeflea poritis TaxID=2993659 RepID=A0ABT4VJ30_9HYPH|nr:NAD(P)-binding domain-containing protein [Hoeflea poritis]MDA4844185.1 NAD(P)-binding domain-containing protein [Hoeflea poritis]
MDIAIVGAGSVGKALAGALKRAGHNICFGVREPDAEKYADLARDYRIAGPSDAVTACEVAILAVGWSAVEDVAGSIGPAAGKIIIDCTNPVAMGKDGLGLTLGFDTSGGERVQALLPQADVVKTFNQIGAEFMADAGRLSPQPVMFVAGDSEQAKSVALALVRDVGFDAQNAGPLTQARLLEPLAMLWIWSAMKGDLGREFGFALAR